MQSRHFSYIDTYNADFANLFTLKRANHPTNLPAPAFNKNFLSPNNQPQYYQHQNSQFQRQFQISPQQHQQPQFQTPPQQFFNYTKLSTISKNKSFWNEFKRIYITEVLSFTMSKSTLFTLIFSFMFLGCVFFLTGFFTATNIYREKSSIDNPSKHIPTETAMLQGRPEKVINMSGAGIGHSVPKSYQYQGGVKVNQNVRRPSQYVEQQINSNQPYYR